MSIKKIKKQIYEELDNIPDIYDNIKPTVYHECHEFMKDKKKRLIIKRLVFYSIISVIMLACIINVISVSVYNHNITKISQSLEYKKVNTAGAVSTAMKSSNMRKKKNIFQKIFSIELGCAAKDMTSPSLDADFNEELISGSSTTNVQVEGIDEADVIKSYENKVYYVVNGVLYFFTVNKAEIKPEKIYYINSTITNYADNKYELFKTDDYLILFITTNSYYSSNQSLIILFDNNNDIVKEFCFNGRICDSRLFNDAVYFVITERIYNVEEPSYTIDNNKTTIKYADINYCQGISVDSYIHLVSLDLNTLEYDIITDLGTNSYSAIYMNENALYLASKNYINYTTYTTIMRYKIDNKMLVYDKACVFEGIVNNQWYLDEYEGYLRVAAINQNAKSSSKINKVIVYKIDTNSHLLEEVGYLDEGIGLPYQTIRSVRFSENYVSIVTYENKDPLYKIEFENGITPVIVSVLEAPGYSAYLQSFTLNGKNYLLGLGYTDDGRTKLSLYENTDDGNVQIGTDYIIDGYNVEALTNHRAILQMYYDETFIFGFGVNELYYNRYYRTSEYLLFKINLESAIQPIELWKEVEISTQYNQKLRMIFIDDYFYFFSDSKVIVYNKYEGKLTSLEEYKLNDFKNN